MEFKRFNSKFYLGPPSSLTGLQLYKGAWKFDFDNVTPDEIYGRVRADARPRWCAEIFPQFQGMKVLELGPADGYHTAALEELGADVTSIEGNVDAFLRCLILKNALGLRAQFELGDFTKALDTGREIDLLYACGVLYHLQDPIGFLDSAAQCSERLFLWTHFYDDQYIDLIEHERDGFAARVTNTRHYKGRAYTYYEKRYDLQHVELLGYIGGLNETANYVTRDDLFQAIDAAGYNVLRVYEDPYRPGQLPAVNVFATRR